MGKDRDIKSAEAKAAVAEKDEAVRRATELQYLADFARLITGLSGRFINVHSDGIDCEINRALAEIGVFAQVDRSYVFQFSADGTRVSNTHEWCAEGIEPGIDRMQDAPVEQFAWAMTKFKRGEVLYITDVAAMPPEAAEERRELEQQQVRALINVPLTCAGKVMGFLGFDAVRSRKTWGEETISLLKVVGEIIAGAIERERATDTLTQQGRMEMLVAEISTRFISVPTLDLDDEIGRAIGNIGEFTGVDRSYLFQFSEDGETMDNTHEWCGPDIEPHISRLQRLPVAAFAYSMERMRRGKTFYVANVADLPEEAAREKEEFEKEGIKTLINVPIMARDVMIGFLGFDAVRSHKPWPDNDIRLLRIIADVIVNALERKRVNEALEASVQEKEVLLREIHHRVKNNLQVIHSLLYLQASAIQDQGCLSALEAFRESRDRVKAMATIHDRLYRSANLSSIDFEDYLQVLIADLLGVYGGGGKVRVDLIAEKIHLRIDQAIPCGLIVNELVTNSLKHAFPPGGEGWIQVTLRSRGKDLVELAVRDNGKGIGVDEALKTDLTLGLQLVQDLVDQLGGEMLLGAEQGSRFTIRFGKES